MVFLVFSMLASVAVWTYLFSFKFSIALITAVFIHEYGHFYWMGKEGIKNKDMFFMPPFGAIARAKEPWTSYGAELRIALAGPIAGLLSVLLFYVLWLVYPSDIFLASVALAGMINLFNLALPIAILDGGRVIKSILYSISRNLGDMFYMVGFFLIATAFIYGYLSLFFVMLIGYFLFQEWGGIMHGRAALEQLGQRIEQIKTFAKEMDMNPNSGGVLEDLENDFSRLDAVVNMKRMSRKEMVLGLMFFVGIIFTYWVILSWAGSQIDLFKPNQYFQ